MSLCVRCVAELPGDQLMCEYHSKEMFDAEVNKIWCDFVHRGIEIPRLYETPLSEWEDWSPGDGTPATPVYDD